MGAIKHMDLYGKGDWIVVPRVGSSATIQKGVDAAAKKGGGCCGGGGGSESGIERGLLGLVGSRARWRAVEL